MFSSESAAVLMPGQGRPGVAGPLLTRHPDTDWFRHFALLLWSWLLRRRIQGVTREAKEPRMCSGRKRKENENVVKLFVKYPVASPFVVWLSFTVTQTAGEATVTVRGLLTAMHGARDQQTDNRPLRTRHAIAPPGPEINLMYTPFLHPHFPRPVTYLASTASIIDSYMAFVTARQSLSALGLIC